MIAAFNDRERQPPLELLLSSLGRDIGAKAEELVLDFPVRAPENIPRSMTVNGKICLFIAVVIARNKYIGCQAPTNRMERVVGTVTHIPSAVGKPKESIGALGAPSFMALRSLLGYVSCPIFSMPSERI